MGQAEMSVDSKEGALVVRLSLPMKRPYEIGLLPSHPCFSVGRRNVVVRAHGWEAFGACSGEVAVAENAEDAVRFGNLEQPSVVFLDIELNQMHGFVLLPESRALRSALLILFVTAFEENAVSAFEWNALDYLLKPLQRECAAVTLLRLIKE